MLISNMDTNYSIKNSLKSIYQSTILIKFNQNTKNSSFFILKYSMNYKMHVQ